MTNIQESVIAVVCIFVLTAACAYVDKQAKKTDVASVASECQKSEDACAAYHAAVIADVIKADPKADAACAAVENLCE